MAKDTSDKGERAGQQGPRRKPVTIDLPAEEVDRKPAAGDGGTAAEVSQSVAGSTGGDPEPVAKASPPDEPKAAAAAAPDPGPNPKMSSSDAMKSDRSARPTPSAAESAGAGPGRGPQVKAADASFSFVPLLVAAILGGVMVALVVVLLARGGFFLPAPDTSGPDLAAEIATLKDEVAALKQAGAQDNLAPLRSELAALKQSLDELSNREPTPAPDTAALTDLQNRVATLSSALTALKSAGGGDASAVAGSLADLTKEVDALSARLKTVPGEERIAALETNADALSRKVDELSPKIDSAAALAPAVAADGLAAALEAGRPFTAELAALRTLGVDAKAVDGLAPYGDSGLPTLSALRAEFEAAIAPIDLSAPIPEGTGVVDRLLASARGLVAVRPAHPTEGADPAAVVARIRGALDAGDLKTALTEWDALPGGVKDATANWAKVAAARRDADDLVAELRAAALSRLEAGR